MLRYIKLRYRYCLSKNEYGEREVSIVTDRIYGQDLAQALQDNPSGALLSQAEVLVHSLTDYYINKGVAGGNFWFDVGLGQFMYGHKKDGKDKIYLVDVDPIFRHYDPKGERYEETANYLTAFEELGRFTSELHGIHKEIAFGDTGERVRKHLNAVSLSHLFRSYIEDIKHYFD